MMVSVPTFDVRMMIVFLKSISRPSPSSQHALVEHLVEQLLHIVVGLFHFVEQHDAIGLAPHRLGQHAAFAIADIAGRRALERRNLVRFLIFRHVDHDHVLVAAIENVGQGHRGFGFADAAGPTSMNTPIGLRGSSSLARAVRMRCAIASSACGWPMTRSSSFSFS